MDHLQEAQCKQKQVFLLLLLLFLLILIRNTCRKHILCKRKKKNSIYIFIHCAEAERTTTSTVL